MIDKSVRHTLTLREKKLTKKLKNYAKKSFKKLLILLMKQEVYKIIIQDIFKSLLSIYKMIFQNLPLKLQNDVDDNEIIQISLIMIKSKDELNDL